MKRLIVALCGVLLAVGVTTAVVLVDTGGNPERVVVRVDSAADAQALVAEQTDAGGQVRHVYAEVLDGFAATLPPDQVEALRSDPRVTAVVPDSRVHEDAAQTDPPWGLDRIDQRDGFDGVYAYDTTGVGVTVYVVDSGVRLGHDEFDGRARSGRDFVDGDDDASDCSGHGTAVAGTIGGRTFGVAKDVDLVSLRVLDCAGSGWASDVIAALDWAAGDRRGPAVVNLSGGGSPNDVLDDAVAGAALLGLPVVTSAGNDGGDACAQSPARAPSAITVGATDRSGARAPSSNGGDCLDLFAPGEAIRSSAGESDSASAERSGTSMAAPHVTGVVARHLQANGTATAKDVAAELRRTATTGAVSGSARDALLYAAPTRLDRPTWTLTVTKDGSGRGTVTSSPAGITCGAGCTADFAAGASVTLTPTPKEGSYFTGWLGGCAGATTTCTVTMTEARTVVATFGVADDTFEETVAAYGSWYVFSEPTADGGSWRTTGDPGSAATLTFTGSEVTWVTRRGPRQGIATVTVDGADVGTFDLYRDTAEPFSVTFDDLDPTGSHTLVVTATGRRNPSSAASGIVVDAFRVGAETVQDSAAEVRYGDWAGVASKRASGGAYRSSGTADAVATFDFTGTRVDWLTVTGPGWGRARVSIDGVDQGVVDLYARADRWRSVQTFDGLEVGEHTITITVLGAKNPAATSTDVAIDGFVVQ